MQFKIEFMLFPSLYVHVTLYINFSTSCQNIKSETLNDVSVMIVIDIETCYTTNKHASCKLPNFLE